MTDLVKRLRGQLPWQVEVPTEAADRIERLEAALRKVADANGPHEARSVAHQALAALDKGTP